MSSNEFLKYYLFKATQHTVGIRESMSNPLYILISSSIDSFVSSVDGPRPLFEIQLHPTTPVPNPDHDKTVGNESNHLLY